MLSQSPFQRLPDSSTKSSPDSVVQSSRMHESGSLSGAKHDGTPATHGLDSTAKNSQFAWNGIQSGTVESMIDSRKRKLTSHQAQSVPIVNLDMEFSLIAEAAGKNSSMQLQVEGRTEDNVHIFDDDQFFEGIDLDAVEEEAAKLLKQKSERPIPKTAGFSEPVGENVGFLGFPSFDLGF